MEKWYKYLVGISLCLGLVFFIFVVNQLSQLYVTLTFIHPLFALLVVAVLASILIYWLVKSVWAILKLPKEIRLADGASPEEYNQYLWASYQRLKKNPQLIESSFDWQVPEAWDNLTPKHFKNPELLEITPEAQIALEDELKRAYQALDQVGIQHTKDNAQKIFLTTSISQNGSLDAMTVLILQVKMVWYLIKLYDARPSLGKIIGIYTNVATTVLMARGIEDIDLIEAQVEPLITSILGGSVLSLIPGSVAVTNLIANSILEGSINALLTLRVGIVTMDYLSAVKDIEADNVKRSATFEATKLLGQIIKDGSVNVIQVIMNSVKNAGIQTGRKLMPFQKN